MPSEGTKTVLFVRFYMQMIICQDRLGTNIGKALKKSGVFWQLVDMLDPEKWPRVTGKKSHLCAILYSKMIGLPRQAQDRHGENSKRDAFSTAMLTDG